jgi:hypothetical protein
MNPADDVTLGEIARNVASLRTDMGEKFAGVNRRLDTLEYVPRGEHNIQMREMADRIAAVEEWKKWSSRTLVASFLFPLLVAAVVALVITR